MAALNKVSAAQYPLVVPFEWNFDDTMENTTGNSVAMGVLTSGSNTVFDIFYPPPNSYLLSGKCTVLTAFATSTANTVDIGDSDDTDRYTEAGAIDLQDVDGAATVIDFLGDGKLYNGSQAIRLTISNATGAATAGRAIITLTLAVLGRANENLRVVTNAMVP